MEWTKEEIRTLRRRLGWTQADLARRLNLSSLLVDHWEEGAQVPTDSVQQQLEFLSHQALLCNEEVHFLPVAEQECDRESIDQIDLQKIKN